jgi:penicillin-binding protein 1A
MKNSDRWKYLKDEGLSEADIRKTFKTKVPMKVFAGMPRERQIPVMTPLDSSNTIGRCCKRPLW